MKILYIDPVNTDFSDRHFKKVLNRAACPGTQVDVTYLSQPDEPISPFLPPIPTYHGVLFHKIKQAEEDGYDGVIIGCSADPGLMEAKRIVSIPVTAPLEANLHLAALLRARVTILIPAGVEARTRYWDMARNYGLAHKIASIVSVDLHYPPQEDCIKMVRKEPEKLLNLILEDHKDQLQGPIAEQARHAIRDDGAQAIFLGCTYWTGMANLLAEALAGSNDPLDQRFAETLEVPVLDPGIGSLRVVEALANTLINPSG